MFETAVVAGRPLAAMHVLHAGVALLLWWPGLSMRDIQTSRE